MILGLIFKWLLPLLNFNLWVIFKWGIIQIFKLWSFNIHVLIFVLICILLLILVIIPFILLSIYLILNLKFLIILMLRHPWFIFLTRKFLHWPLVLITTIKSNSLEFLIIVPHLIIIPISIILSSLVLIIIAWKRNKFFSFFEIISCINFLIYLSFLLKNLFCLIFYLVLFLLLIIIFYPFLLISMLFLSLFKILIIEILWF